LAERGKPHPGPLQRRGSTSVFKVLSFGEDLGEAFALTTCGSDKFFVYLYNNSPAAFKQVAGLFY